MGSLRRSHWPTWVPKNELFRCQDGLRVGEGVVGRESALFKCPKARDSMLYLGSWEGFSGTEKVCRSRRGSCGRWGYRGRWGLNTEGLVKSSFRIWILSYWQWEANEGFCATDRYSQICTLKGLLRWCVESKLEKAGVHPWYPVRMVVFEFRLSLRVSREDDNWSSFPLEDLQEVEAIMKLILIGHG